MIKIFLFLNLFAFSTCNPYDYIDILQLSQRLGLIQFKSQSGFTICECLQTFSDLMQKEEREKCQIKTLELNNKEMKQKIKDIKIKKSEIEQFIIDQKVLKRFSSLKKLEKLLDEKEAKFNKAEANFKDFKHQKELETLQLHLDLKNLKVKEKELADKIKNISEEIKLISDSYEKTKDSVKDLESHVISESQLIGKLMELEKLKNKFNNETEEFNTKGKLLLEGKRRTEENKRKLENLTVKLNGKNKTDRELKEKFDNSILIIKNLEECKVKYQELGKLLEEESRRLKELEENKEFKDKENLKQLLERDLKKQKEILNEKEKEVKDLPFLIEKLQKMVSMKKTKISEIENDLKNRELEILEQKRSSFKQISSLIGFILFSIFLTVILIIFKLKGKRSQI